MIKEFNVSKYHKLLYGLLYKVRPAFLTDILKRLLLIRRRVFVTKYGKLFIDPVTTIGKALIQDTQI